MQVVEKSLSSFLLLQINLTNTVIHLLINNQTSSVWLIPTLSENKYSFAQINSTGQLKITCRLPLPPWKWKERNWRLHENSSGTFYSTLRKQRMVPLKLSAAVQYSFQWAGSVPKPLCSSRAGRQITMEGAVQAAALNSGRTAQYQLGNWLICSNLVTGKASLERH